MCLLNLPCLLHMVVSFASFPAVTIDRAANNGLGARAPTLAAGLATCAGTGAASFNFSVGASLVLGPSFLALVLCVQSSVLCAVRRDVLCAVRLCVFLHLLGEINGGVGQKVQLNESTKNPLVEEFLTVYFFHNRRNNSTNG